ncbi:hypothetical protein VP14_134 [Vibrio phage VPMCC14]|nr:hypothetical protein VP14_134 [Vibrio phage VPMCC14]
MEEVFNLHLYMGASSGLLFLWMLIGLYAQGLFNEDLAIQTEDIEYVVNGKIVKTETWIIKKWKR